MVADFPDACELTSFLSQLEPILSLPKQQVFFLYLEEKHIKLSLKKRGIKNIKVFTLKISKRLW